MDRLGDRFRVVAVDLYGYGQSPAWSAGAKLTLADEVELLEPVLRACGDSFHLVGHSYGAAVALKVALAGPSRVRSLAIYEPVLFSVLFRGEPEGAGWREVAAIRDRTIAAVDRGDLAEAARYFVDYWMGEGTWVSMPEKRRAGISPTMQKVREEWYALVEDPTPLTEFAALAVETRFFIGAGSPASTKGIARLLTRALPRVETVEIPGVGHMGPVTHPDLFNREIERFLIGA